MGGEKLPVERPPGAETVEVGFAVQGEVGEVGDEEDSGKKERREHGCAMLWDAARADEDEAGDQRDGAEGVEDGVEQRQRPEVSASDVKRRMEVDEIADERAGSGADEDDGGDDAWWSAEICAGDISGCSALH